MFVCVCGDRGFVIRTMNNNKFASLEGKFTSTIYGYIRDQKYASAIEVLTYQLQLFPRNRPALSLIGYCQYYMQDFVAAAQTYELLVKHYPSVVSYKVYYAQALYKAGMYVEATKIANHVDDPSYAQRIQHLKACIEFEKGDMESCKTLIERSESMMQDDPATIVAKAAIEFKEGNFETARKMFVDAINIVGYQPNLAYNIALCYYREEQFGSALKHIAEIIERGVREHPELSVGSNTEQLDVRSVGNSQVLQETALIEAFNLKAAIEFKLKNMDAARMALNDMPPRSESELDAVTLHNQALINVEKDTTNSFRKLNFLLQNPPFPKPTFQNLLVLYCTYQYYDVAADVLAQNAHLTMGPNASLEPGVYEFLEALIMVPTSPAEAFRKFDRLTKKHVDGLRKFTKKIQDARLSRDNDAISDALKTYDESLDKYVPVLMSMAKIYWDRENYPMVEKIFRQSAEFCSEHDVWKLNVAHVFFMQDNKFADAIRYYEPVVRSRSDNLLEVPAIVLANLCVSYIMTSQNEEAEELMRSIEKEEDQKAHRDPSAQSFHLCIVNLVIGTLYCSKGNFEFGISRIIKSFDLFEKKEKKLGTDTWFYAKRCLVALAVVAAKQMITLKDETYDEILGFLESVEQLGKKIPTKVGIGAEETSIKDENVAIEAKLIRRVFLKLMD